MLTELLGSMGMGMCMGGGVDVSMSVVLETGFSRSSLKAGWCVTVAAAVGMGKGMGMTVMSSKVRWVGMFVVMVMVMIEVGTGTAGALPDLLLFNLLNLLCFFR